jgi:hypothetical protein
MFHIKLNIKVNGIFFLVISKLKQAKTTRNISLDIKLFRFYVYYLTIVFAKMKVDLNLRNALMSYVLLVFRISHFRSTCCSKSFEVSVSIIALTFTGSYHSFLNSCFCHSVFMGTYQYL